MGMYTEVFFRAELDEEAYDIISKILDGADPATLKDAHPFFGLERAWGVFRCESYYHPGPFHRLVEHEERFNLRTVSLRNSLKNYSGEIDAFFDWVSPHVVNAHQGAFIGYSLYEEDEKPTLYFTPKENS